MSTLTAQSHNLNLQEACHLRQLEIGVQLPVSHFIPIWQRITQVSRAIKTPKNNNDASIAVMENSDQGGCFLYNT